MGKELTIAQLTFVDLYDSYTLSLSSDVIAVPCDAEGDALNTKIYTIDYQVRAGEEVIKSKCTEARLSATIDNVAVNYNTAGTISVTVNATARIPEDSGIYITIKTDDSNEFAFDRFISFMNIKKGQDGRGYSSRVDQYALTVNTTPPDDDDWNNTFSSPTKDEPYLWNREIIYYDTYTNGVQDRDTTQARIISIYGKDGNPGKGIKFITEYYTASDNAESPVKNTLNANLTEVDKSDSVASAAVDENGYYVVDMGTQTYTHYLAKLTFTISQTTNVIVKCINYAETNYDYMLVSEISTSETQHKFHAGYEVKNDENKIDDSPHVKRDFKNIHSLDPQDVVFENVVPGTYYIYIKIRKDQSNTQEGEKFAFKIVQDGVADWTTSDPDNYGPDYPYLWNYIEFTYTDDTTSTTPPHLSAHWGLDGADAFTLKVVTDVGDVFTQKPEMMIEKITLSLEAYEGANKINVSVPYVWKYYTFDSSDGDDWVELSSGTANIEDISLTVNISDSYAYSMFKCEIQYKNTWFSDYETLKEDVHDVYYAETVLLDDGVWSYGDYAIAYVELYKNNEVIDPLITERIYYNPRLTLSDNGNYGYFYNSADSELGISITYKFFGDEVKDDYAYFLIYDSLRYFEYTTDTDAEYALESDVLVEKGTGTAYYYQKSLEEKYNGLTYRLILARYDGNRWRPYKPYDAYEYCYINSNPQEFGNITFGNSKIFVIDKRKLASVPEFNISIYRKVYDTNIPFLYYVPGKSQSGDIATNDLWKIKAYVTGSDSHIFSRSSSVLQSIKTTYIEEVFSRQTDGVYINQVVTEVDSVTGEKVSTTPFFVKLASEEIGFYSSENTQTPMVHIGNQSTHIRNSVLDDNAIINGKSRFNNDVVLTKNDKQSTGFRWTFDSDGSLSLVITSGLT